MEGPRLDPREFLDTLRQDNEDLRWAPLDPNDEPDRPIPRPLTDSESLAYLHHNWRLADRSGADLPPGLRGRLLRLFGRMTYRVLAPYLREERELDANMVRVHDETARRIDELTAELRRRRVAEAENMAELSAWLHAVWPGPSGVGRDNTGPTGPTGNGDG
jgi:hypothetical protein